MLILTLRVERRLETFAQVDRWILYNLVEDHEETVDEEINGLLLEQLASVFPDSAEEISCLEDLDVHVEHHVSQSVDDRDDFLLGQLRLDQIGTLHREHGVEDRI